MTREERIRTRDALFETFDKNGVIRFQHDYNPFSMKMYSKRRKSKLALIANDLNLESEVKLE